MKYDTDRVYKIDAYVDMESESKINLNLDSSVYEENKTSRKNSSERESINANHKKSDPKEEAKEIITPMQTYIFKEKIDISNSKNIAKNLPKQREAIYFKLGTYVVNDHFSHHNRILTLNNNQKDTIEHNFVRKAIKHIEILESTMDSAHKALKKSDKNTIGSKLKSFLLPISNNLPSIPFITSRQENPIETNNITLTKKTNKKGKTGTLYELIQADFFTIDLLIYNLDKDYPNTSIFDTIVNTMHMKFKESSYFYIPQLTSMISYKENTKSLIDFLLDMCISEIKFSLKLYWLLCADVDDTNDPKIMRLVNQVEETFVKGKRTNKKNFKEVFHLSLNNGIENEKRNNYFKISIPGESRLSDQI